MRLKLLPILLVLLCLMAGTALGSVVGKIVGQVTDMQTGDPIVGVSVAVKGTTMGGMTDADGYYRILNVPVGDYVLTLSAVGYATVEISNVHVSADLASYHDAEMSSKATDLGTTIKVVAEDQMVVKDKTTTIDIVKREDLLAMPTRGFEQLVGIQNSVVRMNAGAFGQRQRGGRTATASNQELNLRGGRPNEVAYYVDGFSQQDALTGVSTANINNNAIQEVSVTSGAFSAEYGLVASGIVNVITNSGGDEYAGNLELQTDNVLNENWDQNFYAADFGGPIPGLDNGYFFFSGERRFLRDRTPSSKTEEMITNYGAAYGLDTLYGDDPQRLPQNSLSGWSYQGKIDYEFNPNLKMQLSGNGSWDSWREYRQEWLLNPDHGPRYEDENLGLNAKITHTLNANTFYNLSASYFMTSRTRGDAQIFDDYEAYDRTYTFENGNVEDVTNPEYDEFNLFWQESEEQTITTADTTWYYTDSTGEGSSWVYTDSAISSTRDTVVLSPASYYPSFEKRKSSYLGLKGDMSTQVGEYHTLKFGFDLQRHTLRYFRNLDATQGYSVNRVNRYGYDVYAEEEDPDGFWNSTKHPFNLGAFLQDRFEWRGVVVNAGLRLDYFDYNTESLKSTYDPLGANGTLDESDLEDSKVFARVSPRLGISFPVSDKTQMHINFGKFWQRPDLIRLYTGYDFYEARITAGSYYPFSSPNLEPEKTTQYEVGITHQLGENVAFSINAYYKDVQDLVQIETINQTASTITIYSIYDNIDFGTIKGVDFSLNMRRTKNMRLELKYTLSYATGTGSYANTAYVINWSNPEGDPKTTNPLDYDQRHNISALFDLRYGKQEGPRFGDIFPLEDLSLNAILYAGSGTPYTPANFYDEVTELAVRPNPRAAVNSANKPWYFNIDVRLERKFTFSGVDVKPFILIRNLLDRDNVIGVYESTGEPGTSGYLNTDAAQTTIADSEAEGTDYESRYLLKEYNATNWSNPRQVFFGVRVSL
ncbi:MAG TPA: TonB-dependent receptor [candidate division Zixibacteria bacterium]|nr:TonB-dependent receptor [candidate division Zixibacteria bacterium]